MLKTILNKLFWGVFRHFLSDRQYICVRYWLVFGFLPNLEKPERLTEKIHWLKLYDRSELRKLVADRVSVREYVAEKIGAEYLIPVIGYYSSLTRQIWDSLPSRFVLKANHGSAMVHIVYNKEDEKFEEIQKRTRKWMNTDFVKLGREWIYKGIERNIIAETMVAGPGGRAASDYKFFCFHGEVTFFSVNLDPFGNHHRNFFDRDLKPLQVTLSLPRKEGPVHLPSQIKHAMEIAERLSEDFNFIRVDLFITDERIYFGELTNFPGNGFNPFEPDEFDLKAGSYLKLN